MPRTTRIVDRAHKVETVPHLRLDLRGAAEHVGIVLVELQQQQCDECGVRG